MATWFNWGRGADDPNPVKTAFLSMNNIRRLAGYVGNDAPALMKKWAAAANLEDYLSAQGDMSETLEYANQQFLEWAAARRRTPAEFPGYGRSPLHPKSKLWPKAYIEDGTEDYDVDDWRAHDAYFDQHVFRTNNNFRYKNALLPWQAALQKRWYDREQFPEGLRDHRELEQAARAYDMSGAWGPNKWTSSDTKMYCMQGPGN